MLQKLKKLKNNAGFMRYFTNTSWMFSEKILRMVAALFVGVWLTRYLGPERLGILSYAQSLTAILLAFSTLGLNSLLTRELVKYPSKKNILLGTALGLQTLGSIILAILMGIVVLLMHNEPITNKILIILTSATFFQSFGVIGNYFQSIVQNKKVVLVGIISLMVNSILKIVLILMNAPLIAFAYVILWDSILMAMGLIFIFYKDVGSLIKWEFSKTKAKVLLKDSWPLILSSIIVSIYMKVDQVMIKELMDADSVGLYAAAVRLSETWYFIPAIISSSLFPAIVNAKNTNEILYYNRLQRLYDLMFYMALSIAIPMTFFSDWVVTFLYGDAFYLSGQVLNIHIWAGVFVFLGVSRGGWVLNENLQRYSIIYLGIGMVTNIVLNYYLIPIIGIEGAAWATLISQAVSVLAAPALFKKTRISTYMMLKSIFFISLFNNNKTMPK